MSHEIIALTRTAERLTGKRVVAVSRIEQTLTEIQADSFQDILHELSHWLIASPEERLDPNLGLPPFNQEDVNPLEAIREAQAIHMHSEIAQEIGMDEDELTYVSYLMEAIGIYLEAVDTTMSPTLQGDLCRPTAAMVAHAYRQELQALV